MTNLFVVALPVVITINLLLGLIVLMTHRRRFVNRVFAMLSLVLALWLGCQYLGSVATSEVWLAFWIRQACATSVFIPLVFHLLHNAVVQPTLTLVHLLRRSKGWLLACLAAMLLVQTRFFLFGAHLATKAHAIGEPVYGPGLPFFALFWIVAVARLVWSFFRSLARATGVHRMELQIIAYGSLFSLVPGLLLVLVIPLLTGSAQSARFTPIAVVTWHSVIAYGIATRHIMGVGEFLQRILVWVLVACVLSLLYLAVFLLVSRLPFHGAVALLRNAAHGIAAAAVALSLAPAKARLQHRAERLFEADHGELAQLVHDGGELARSINTVDALVADFESMLQKSLGVSRVRVIMRSGAQFAPYGRKEGEDASGDGEFSESDPLVQALQATRYPLLRDVLRRAKGTPLEMEAERTLARLNAEAAVALHSKNGMTGFLLLGPRRGGQVYGRREENALVFLGQEMGFAIENATLYTHLRDARIYNEVLLDNLVTGVVATDRAGRVTVCNRDALRILRLQAPDRAIGQPADRILPGAVVEELHASFASGNGVRDRDLVLRPGTPDECSVRFGTAVFSGGAGAATGVLLVLQDISAMRKLEEQVRRGDRLASIGTLAAGMAHEIKNPLVCLKTFVQLLPSQYDNPEFRESFTPLLAQEVERINTIVTQLLDFSRPVKPTLETLSLHAVLEAAWQLAAQQIKSRGLVFKQEHGAERDLLLGDAHLLGQVFLNLFLNGIDAMENGGTLTVSTRIRSSLDQPWRRHAPQVADWIDVQIADTGCGIEPDRLPQVFDPFFTTKPRGTGLGLSVALGIVHEHHGEIEVASTPGAGSCFRVVLPLLSVPDGSRDADAKGSS